MLDLIALQARSHNLSYLDAKPLGERCFYFNPVLLRFGKTVRSDR